MQKKFKKEISMKDITKREAVQAKCDGKKVYESYDNDEDGDFNLMEEDDWEFVDYSNKNIIKCPQCNTNYFVEEQ